jgi:ABC-type sugar transport system permease subunit/ABC-type glycerol-3-phosphate transport system substrate-binding protein
MKLKNFLISLILFSTLTLFAEEKVILKIFKLPDPKSNEAFNRADMAVVEAFREKFPHIELRAYSGIELENMEMDAGPLMAIAGGVSPDVIYVNFRQSSTYIEKNFLYPLDNFIAEMEDNELKERIADPVMPVVRRKKAGTKEKHYWMLPYETLVRVLLYRKDLFYRYGLDPERPPRDWDELLTYAKALTNPEDGTYGLYLAAGQQAAYDWITYLWSAGGDAVLQNEETGEWYASFEGEPALAAMKFYLKLITAKWKDRDNREHTGFVIRDGNWGKARDEGRLGMVMGYMDDKRLGGEIDPNLWGIAPPPKGPTGLRGSEINCRMMGIFSGAGESNNGGLGDRDPQLVRRAAWEYIRFYDSDEARRIRLEVMINAGYGRMQNPLYLKKYGYEEYIRYTPPDWLETFEDALKNGKPEPYGKNTQKIYEFMTYPIEKVISLEEKGLLGETEEEKNKMISEIFTDAVKRTNEKMIGNISEKDRVIRNRTAVFAALFIFIFFSIVLYKVWNIFTPDKVLNSRKKSSKTVFITALLIAPALGSIILWKYVPMLMGSVMAFQDYSVVGDSQWVGLSNFADVLFDPVWWSALARTLYYMTLSLTIGFLPPVFLAILLQEVPRGKIFYRVIYYMPAVISGVIVIYLWKLLYDPSDAGGLNQILLSLGLEKSRWLKEESLAMLLTVIPSVWAGLGPGSLIYLAALKGIPEDIYEAADIDGAGFFKKIRFIVFPYLKSLLFIQFIAAFIASAQQSEFILVMTFGGPNEATKVADLLIFEKAYLYLNFGIATTMAWMLGLLLMLVTVVQIRKLSNMEFKAN